MVMNLSEEKPELTILTVGNGREFFKKKAALRPPEYYCMSIKQD
jgi:hypothetical protein